MREVLREGASGLQTDTIEGVIHSTEYAGVADVHFTTAFDRINCVWVPVLMSLIFGRTKAHYAAHFKKLFESYNTNNDWDSFQDAFTGVTIDWSAAEGSGFLDALLEH